MLSIIYISINIFIHTIIPPTNAYPPPPPKKKSTKTQYQIKFKDNLKASPNNLFKNLQFKMSPQCPIDHK